jgi:hypothetical protein
MNEIEALRRVNFDWAVRLSDVWDDAAWDVPDLHGRIRAEFVRKLDGMRNGPGESPLGWVVVGSGGTGKTHLLGSFRKMAVERKAAFVLVDMTDVRDFWETVLQGYIDSIQQSFPGETFQYQCLLHNIIERLGPSRPVGEILTILAERKSTNLKGDINKVLMALNRVYPRETLKHQNVVRALICMNSEDYATCSMGMTWLQGQPIEETDRAALGFTVCQEQPRKIIEALSWFMGLSGPTILAFDQLDPIVTQLHYRKLGEASPEEQSLAESIIIQIGSGLGAIRDTTRNTLTVVSCVETTWDILSGTVLKTFIDRFESPWRLDAVGVPAVARMVAESRIAPVFRDSKIVTPYSSWPFRPEAFEDLKLDTPREVLKKCERHRQSCLAKGEVTELGHFNGQVGGIGEVKKNEERYQGLDRRLAEFVAQGDPAFLLEEKQEDQRLAPLLQNALQCLLHENELPVDVGGIVDSEFTGGATTRPLHARLRLVFHNESEREEHFCVRALEQTHARAYQARLKAAMTQSGIDRSLKFRRLCVVRSRDFPGGAETQKLTQKFTDSGGVFLKPSDGEIRILNAVSQLRQLSDPDFEGWLKSRKPISKLSLVKGIVPAPQWLDQGNGRATTAVPLGPEEGSVTTGTKVPPVSVPATSTANTAPTRNTLFPLGRRLVAGRVGDPVEMPIGLLEKHTVVLAGAGSGKTVLLRRLIEEARLLGIPSIVIDCANDLATLDEEWTAQPECWLPEDAEKAKRYHQAGDVIVWTPGREGGNPLSLEPLPDLAAFAGDHEGLEAAVAMVREALGPVVAPGQSAAARNKLGVLSRTLRYFAGHGGGRLEDFIRLLDDLPTEAGLGVANESKLAKQMADALKVAVETNPLLRSTGVSLDPAVLFGADGSDRTRISVINFVGLPGLEAQRAFLNQLAMTLFSWIKTHPEPAPRPLRGLLVIDEAKDFVPSQKSSMCKESLTRLAAQARKYHLGLVFATQNPKDIDNKIVANCSTHYYGKVNSPATIAVVRDLIHMKGGSGEDVPRLPRGQFYVHNADAQVVTPSKVMVPLCLSRHPENPLDEAAVLRKAVSSRSLLDCPSPS